MTQVIKREENKEVLFEKNKIIKAIKKAMESSMGVYVEGQAEEIAEEIEQWASQYNKVTIYQIENLVHDKLAQRKNYETARSYRDYQKKREMQRIKNSSDKELESFLAGADKETMEENSNKDVDIISTQRDLIAGIISKDIAKRKILPVDIVQAHEQGAIHVHDMDYMISPSFNCCLVNYKDMFNNDTVINKKKVEKPKSFRVACTVITQIIAQVASNQYGLI